MKTIRLETITPLILTYNEAPNICDTLKRLEWAHQIVVVDSHSMDQTVEIASAFPNVRVVSRVFDNHTAQWNFGLDQIETDWVLTLDADYRCPSEFIYELESLAEVDVVYFAHFRYCVLGKTVRGTLYPPRAVLFKPLSLRYLQDGHTQLLEVKDQSKAFLATHLLHDDYKPLSAWCSAQTRYAQLETIKLTETPYAKLDWKDRLRCWYVIAPILTFFYCLFFKRLILDGKAGWYYTMQRVYVEWLFGMALLDRNLRSITTNGESRQKPPVLPPVPTSETSGNQGPP